MVHAINEENTIYVVRNVSTPQSTAKIHLNTKGKLPKPKHSLPKGSSYTVEQVEAKKSQEQILSQMTTILTDTMQQMENLCYNNPYVKRWIGLVLNCKNERTILARELKHAKDMGCDPALIKRAVEVLDATKGAK